MWVMREGSQLIKILFAVRGYFSLFIIRGSLVIYESQ